MRQWKLQKPDIVISVHGGLKNFKLDPHHKEIFNRGLIKAAKTTHSGAWIITGKINSLLNLLYHTYFIIIIWTRIIEDFLFVNHVFEWLFSYGHGII